MKRWTLAVLMACALGLAAPAWADTVSDYLAVRDANGNVVYSVSVTESLEDPNEIYFINVPGLVNVAQFGNATTLCEGFTHCSPTDGFYSDIYGIASINGDLFLAFNSDSETAPAAYGSQGAIFLPEGNGGIFDATQYLDPSLVAQGYTAQFFSDSDNKIPEPGTMTLLGTGLLGAIGSLRKRLG